MKNLSERALLVNIKISQWSARKYDKTVSHEIEKTHNAHDAGRFNKNLIKEEELSAIKKVASATRTLLYDNSLPWGDNGDRLLPTSNYFEFLNQFSKYKEDFNSKVDLFIRAYPSLKEEAKARLNGMFREQDYPSHSDMKRKFSMDMTFMPISNISDFRLNVDQEEVDNIKSNIEAEIYQRISDATKNIWSRIRDAVQHMVEKLKEHDAVFRDSLVNNIEDLIETLPRLNFTGDRDISNVIENMKDLIVDPDDLRHDTRLRKQKADQAEAILSTVGAFLNC
ncbi:DUF3150 domain-containing protein [Paraflavitalea sp. CAU 1676]|uniref:DUF3150 domain-containing protein n=1 Tax=Paraflavitalea sp. CAU 1676 TaxID=3032598 RepID=UPI0023DA1790|nr:DUF3150 domain-containing protein [Paraflavitalea sp. CAU 1676]MDF2190496.1 DUF3150 domain-containing protein [Paraflavitalea sp. CAU 1676]